MIKCSPSLLILVWSLKTLQRCERCICFLTASMGKSIIHVLKIRECAEKNRKTHCPHPQSYTIFCHKRALSASLSRIVKPETENGFAFLTTLNNLPSNQSSFIWGN